MLKNNAFNFGLNTFFKIAVIIVLPCCGALEPVASDTGTIKVEFTFKEINMCGNGLSPMIKLENVPTETVYIKAIFKDYHHPMFDHGGGTVLYDSSNIIKQGSLKSYYGPCPDKSTMERNEYCFIIQALDNNGNIIAWGKKSLMFGWIDL